MTRSVWIAAAVAFATILMAGDVAGQGAPRRPGGGDGWAPGSPFNRLYDPTTVETVKGEVLAVESREPLRGMGQGFHLRLKTEKEEIPVHLGPAWFIENQEIAIEEKDEVEVRGSRVRLEGKSAIIAAEVRKGEDILTLRDPDGRLVWAGWRRRR